MEEIIDAVLFEIENSDCMEKLSAGIVLTGGGSLLRYLPQLVNYRSGMDVRIGYPNIAVASDTHKEIVQPMYSTSIGLLLKGYEILENKKEQAEATADAGKGNKDKSKKENRISKFIKNLSDIFVEENDAKM
jgi:cell division protein FtsA